jgi:hypothetical protein
MSFESLPEDTLILVVGRLLRRKIKRKRYVFAGSSALTGKKLGLCKSWNAEKDVFYVFGGCGEGLCGMLMHRVVLRSSDPDQGSGSGR